MGNYINLLFDNNNFGTVLIYIDKEEMKTGCITTGASCGALTLSGSAVFECFDSTRMKQIRQLDDLLKCYAPRGRAFLSTSTYYILKKNGARLKIYSNEELTIGEEYNIEAFTYFMGKGSLIYKGIFPGALWDFYDLYKEDMFEESLKAAPIKNEETERKLRLAFKAKVEKGLI